MSAHRISSHPVMFCIWAQSRGHSVPHGWGIGGTPNSNLGLMPASAPHPPLAFPANTIETSGCTSVHVTASDCVDAREETVRTQYSAAQQRRYLKRESRITETPAVQIGTVLFCAPFPLDRAPPSAVSGRFSHYVIFQCTPGIHVIEWSTQGERDD